MASLDDNKCVICSREIDNKEKCRVLQDGTLEVDHYSEDGQEKVEAIFYENENEPPEALICEGCEAEHVRLVIHGRELVEACKHVRNNLIGESEENFEHEIAHLDYAIAKIEGSKKP